MTAATDTLSDTIGTRQPFDLSERLASTINELGMRPQIDQMRDEG